MRIHYRRLGAFVLIYIVHVLLVLFLLLAAWSDHFRRPWASILNLAAILGVLCSLIVAFWTSGFLASCVALVMTLFVYPHLIYLVSVHLLPTPRHGLGYVPPLWLTPLSNQLARLDAAGEIGEFMEMMRNLGSSRPNRRDVALNNLIRHCVSNKQVLAVMKKHDISDEDLASIYQWLVTLGACHWAKGHYVPASTIAYAHTLDYVLGYRQRHGDYKTVAERHSLAKTLIQHFEERRPIGVPP